MVTNNLKIFHKDRFVNKNPRNSLRIGFLNEIFPDAIFLHLIRDGRAVANSILRSRMKHNGDYWGVQPPGWQSLLDKPPLEACALQWKLTVEQVQKSAEELPADRYLEVRYEDFVSAPLDIFEMVFQRCGLGWKPEHWKGILEDLQNMNYKWQENFDSRDTRGLNSQLGDLLTRLGYMI